MTKAGQTEASYQVPAATEPRSPWPGRIGLGAVCLALVGAVASAIPLGTFMADSMYAAGYFTNPDIALLPNSVANAARQQMAIVLLLCGFGTAGWIVSIVAAVTRRGRNLAMAGIIIGALAPILIGGVLVLSIVTHLPNAG